MVYAVPPVGAGEPSSSKGLLYRFGPYQADPRRGELRKFGIRVRLERKPWQILLALLERPGDLVTRTHLRTLLWGDNVFVDFENGLNVAVKKLRSALNDSAETPVYIETAAGEGYRFIAKIEQGSTTANSSESVSFVPDQPASFPPAALSAGANSPLLTTGARQPGLWKRTALISALGIVCIAVVALTGARWTTFGMWGRSTERAGKVMLVVLPFENLSGDPSQEYLSDGMTEELSARLGNLNPQRLGVIGRTSAMTYKHSPRSVSQIGKELAVGYVLEGSVRREGSKLRVTAQLVEVSGQTHVWAQTYDRDVRALLQVEDEIASDIVREVGVSMALGQPPKSLRRHLPAPEAHEAYLLGRYYWNKRTPEGWVAGEKYFRLAIEKDSEYAAAYAGLAECRIPKKEAQAAASRAVALDPRSGEARTALGWVEMYIDLDIAAAEQTLKTAVQLDPNYAPAHHTYSQSLDAAGHMQEAISEETQALLLDPLSLVSEVALADLLSATGQHDRGEQHIKQVIEMDPRRPKAHEILGNIYLRRGMYQEAIREYQVSEDLGGDKLTGQLGYAYALAGNRREALRKRYELQEMERKSGFAAVDLALVELALGNHDSALACLERVYYQHEDEGLLALKVEPAFDPLRGEPRFQDLLRRMNFPL